MKAWSKPFGVVAIFAMIFLAWTAGTQMVRTAGYARAAQDVEATRQELSTVQDLARVYKLVGKAVEPSVVKLEVHKKMGNTAQDQQDLLKRFFPDTDGDGEPNVPPGLRIPNNEDDFEAQGTGSGVIVEVDGKTGYVMTNNHVAGGASELTVTLGDGREIKDAKLVGADPKSDLAVVKIEAEGLIPAKWGNSDYLEKGELICAFGSPFGYVGSMTHGIVSALNRDRVRIIDSRYAYENFIQVDAPINPGNSGGPLVNLRGEVVGINTAIASRTGAFSGIGFAIPSNQARFVYDQIRETGKVVRGWLGVQIDNVANSKDAARHGGYDGNSGVMVKGILKGSPSAEKLELGDIIVGINGKSVQNMTELRNMVAATPPGKHLIMDVVRAGAKQQVTVVLGEQPDDLDQIAHADASAGSDGAITLDNLGLQLQKPTAQLLSEADITDATQGALVASVRPGHPAALAGLRPGDLITRIGETPIKSPADVKTALTKDNLAAGVNVRIVNKEGTSMQFLKTK